MGDLRNNPGYTEISFSYHRFTGARSMHGGVTIKFEADKPYSFESFVEWPADHNYESFVIKGIEQALQEKLGSLQKTRVHLVGIEIDEIASVPHGFQSAAYAATCAAFLV